MNIHKSTKQYETWLNLYTPLVQADLDLKHRLMSGDLFSFMRATFYRWLQVWPLVCEQPEHTPNILAVGDLHVENFGTWRDADGRLVWGVNDFDEAAYLPYTIDLIRLATSAQLAIEANHLTMEYGAACDAILSGYTAGLRTGGKPFVLAENHSWLRDIAHSNLRDPVHFWEKMDALPKIEIPIPQSAAVAIEQMLPAVDAPYHVAHRVAGLGSLGHPRYVAVADWQGGRLAREAKALVPSAAAWVSNGDHGSVEIFYQAIVERSVRCRDPFIRLAGHWIVRRLAPDCSRIELVSLPETRAELRLLNAMGWETANIHLNNRTRVKAILQDLKARDKNWLRKAADAMTAALHKDWERWKAE